MPDDLDSVDAVLASSRWKRLRSFIGKGTGQDMLDALIVEAEQQIAENKRRFFQ